MNPKEEERRMKQSYTVGVDAGGTKVAYGLFGPDGALIERAQHPTDANADGPALCDRIVETVRALTARHGLAVEALQGIGVCMPSYLLYEEGVVLITSTITGVKDFPMRAYLAERLPTRIVLDNDANVAALAENRHGAGLGARNMVYIAASTGIGSGLILDGRLFHGSYGWAGECGHMLATPDEGVLCGCQNRGCFQSHISGRYIPEYVRRRLAEGAQSTLDENADAVAILGACRAGDPLARETVARMAHWLAVCVYNIYQLLNVNLYVFGGGLVNFGETLFAPMREEFDRYNQIPYPVDFRFAECPDFGIVGAAELVKEEVK